MAVDRYISIILVNSGLLIPLAGGKIKFLKNLKKNLGIILYCACVPNITTIGYVAGWLWLQIYIFL